MSGHMAAVLSSQDLHQVSLRPPPGLQDCCDPTAEKLMVLLCLLPVDQLLIVGGASCWWVGSLMTAESSSFFAQRHSELSCSTQELLSLDLQQSASRAPLACSQPGTSSTSCFSQVLAHPGRGHLRGGGPRRGQVCSSADPPRNLELY